MAPVEERFPKTCFVIAPIGEIGSPTRSRSDKILRHIVTPAAVNCGYQVVRSDRESQPGMIASQVINHLVDDDLVIADLTDHNPNVFYELAIRHMIRKPIVQIIQAGQRLPFDVVQSRTIFVDHTDLDSAADCREQLVHQILAVECDPAQVDNPITQAVKLNAMDKSVDPEEKRDAQIIGLLQELMKRVDRLEISRAENPYFRETWNKRSLRTVQEFQQFLNKFEDFRNLSAEQRVVVREKCMEQARSMGYLSQNEAAAELNQYLLSTGGTALNGASEMDGETKSGNPTT